MSEKEEKDEKEGKKDLESSLTEKLEPTIDDALHRFIGVTINELKHDLSDRLRRPWIVIEPDISMPFKIAKIEFKRKYFLKLLLLNFGNISEVARIAGVNRRSIHRLIKEVGIDVDKIREDMIKRYDIKQETVNNIIENVLDQYKQVIHPEKLESMYKNVSEISKALIEDLPEEPQDLDTAEKEFERKYITRALREHDYNISKTAKTIGLRFETLHRKMKSLGIKNKNDEETV